MSSIQNVSNSGVALIRGLRWEDVADEIYKSKKLKFKWAQNRDKIAHTSIIIQLDKTPRYTLDYGGKIDTIVQKAKVGSLYVSDKISQPSGEGACSYPRKAFGDMPMKGVVNLKSFKGGNLEIRGTLATLTLDTHEQKRCASGIFLSLKGIDIGDYVATKNNCRTYLIMVARKLRELFMMDEETWNTFSGEIMGVLIEDERKFLEFVRSNQPIQNFDLKDERQQPF